MLSYCLCGFGTQVKERKVRKVKEIDFNPVVCPENAVLAERSFIGGQHKPSLDNGYCLEWTNKMDHSDSPSHDGHAEVGICLVLKRLCDSLLLEIYLNFTGFITNIGKI